MSVTIKFLSEKANLSPTAVSLILNEKDVRVSKEKRELVLKLAKKYNYIPNSLAVGLVTKKSYTVGLILPDLENLFFTSIAKNIEQLLNQHGYYVILCNSNDHQSKENEYARHLIARGVDLLLVCGTIESMQDNQYLELYKSNNTPCIAFDRWSEKMDCSSITFDSFRGAYMACKHLIDLGHKRIACIAGPMDSYSAKQRLEGYYKALKDYAIPIDDSIMNKGDYHYESGYIEGRKLLDKGGFTSIFVCNDMMTYGFYQAVREKELSIPDDVSVVGYDDLFFSKMLDVPLTTVKQDTKVLSKKLCEMALRHLAGDVKRENVDLDTTLIIRNSTKSI